VPVVPAQRQPEGGQREGGCQQIESGRDPDNGFVVGRVQGEEQGGDRPGQRPWREAPRDEQHECRAGRVQEQVGDVELPRGRPRQTVIDGMRDEAERTVVLEELGAEELEHIGGRRQAGQPVQDHEIVADEAGGGGATGCSRSCSGHGRAELDRRAS
jgi:hypothetical protein